MALQLLRRLQEHLLGLQRREALAASRQQQRGGAADKRGRHGGAYSAGQGSALGGLAQDGHDERGVIPRSEVRACPPELYSTNPPGQVDRMVAPGADR